MKVLPFNPVDLVAIDPARNIRRRWQVSATRDLFGHIVIETSWGRIGTTGRHLIRSFAEESEATRYVTGLLRIRASAPRRIGVSYTPITDHAALAAS